MYDEANFKLLASTTEKDLDLWFYFNVSLLEVDVEANENEADVDEQGEQATNDEEHLWANILMPIYYNDLMMMIQIPRVMMVSGDIVDNSGDKSGDVDGDNDNGENCDGDDGDGDNDKW